MIMFMPELLNLQILQIHANHPMLFLYIRISGVGSAAWTDEY